MKGIILAGGTGSRLYLTKVTNKHLLPVGKYPMIFHSVHKLKQSNIGDILIVTGKEHMGTLSIYLAAEMGFTLHIRYRMKQEELLKHLTLPNIL